MKFNGTELKDLFPIQKEKFNQRMENYNKNLKLVAQRAKADRDKFTLSYSEIGMLAGISSDAVSEFLRGKSAPHVVTVSAICGAITLLKRERQKQKKQ